MRRRRAAPRPRGRRDDREPVRARGADAPRRGDRRHARRRGSDPARGRGGGRARDAASGRGRRRHRGRRRVHRLPRRLAARGPRRARRRSAAPASRARSPRRASARRRRCRPPRRSTRSCDARRSSSTATPATTTRSRSCSRSPRPRSSCAGSRPSPATRRSTRRRGTRSRCSSSPAAPTFRSRPARTRRSARRCATRANVHGESGLDGPDLPEPTTKPVDGHAADLLAEWLEPGVVLVPTGPLTNVALLLRAASRREGRLERIVWMGGAIAEGNVTPAAEFNAFVDPEAAAARLRQRHPGDDDRARRHAQGALRRRRTPTGCAAPARAGRAVAELADFFLEFHRQRYRFDGAPIHDAIAVAHVIDPTLVETLHCNVAIETASQFCDGRTVVDRWLVTRRAEERPRRHRRRRGAVPRAARRADRARCA